MLTVADPELIKSSGHRTGIRRRQSDIDWQAEMMNAMPKYVVSGGPYNSDWNHSPETALLEAEVAEVMPYTCRRALGASLQRRQCHRRLHRCLLRR
jgi:hypothetical protein